jgi:hypothetical protein
MEEYSITSKLRPNLFQRGGKLIWRCMYVGAFMLMVVAIVDVVQTSTPNEKHHTIAQVNEL